jgi:hypothetical protein
MQFKFLCSILKFQNRLPLLSRLPESAGLSVIEGGRGGDGWPAASSGHFFWLHAAVGAATVSPLNFQRYAWPGPSYYKGTQAANSQMLFVAVFGRQGHQLVQEMSTLSAGQGDKTAISGSAAHQGATSQVLARAPEHCCAPAVHQRRVHTPAHLC